MTTCPWCQNHLDEHDPLDGVSKPSDGDVSICLHCTRISKFESGELVKPSEQELNELLEDPQVIQALAMVYEAHLMSGG